MLVGLVACGGDDPPAEPDETTADASVTKPDAQTGATAPSNTKPDARVEPPPEVTLASLAGKYLLRMDTFGTTTAPTLSIRSRASQLWVAELTVDGDKLKSSERLCSQVSKQVCAIGCDSAETVIDEKVITDFLQKRTFERTYTLSEDGTFTGETSVALLGYDDPDNGAVPTDKDAADPRIWDVVPGAPREGLLTTVKISAPENPILGEVTCTVFGAQRFVSKFSGLLQGTVAKPVFPSMSLVLDESDGRTIASSGGLACGGTSSAKSPVTSASARLLRYDSGDALDCGDLSDFDKLLPAEEP